MVGFGVASAFSSNYKKKQSIQQQRQPADRSGDATEAERFSALWLIKGKRVIKEMAR